MGLVARGLGRPVAGVMVALLAGCGGSVADADSRGVPTTRAAPTQASPFCAAVRANAEALRPLAGLAGRGTVPPDQLTSTVAAVRRTGADLLDTAPTGLRTDVQVTVNALDVELTALVSAGGDATAAAGDPAVTAQSTSTDLAAAGQRVTDYIIRNCRPT